MNKTGIPREIERLAALAREACTSRGAYPFSLSDSTQNAPESLRTALVASEDDLARAEVTDSLASHNLVDAWRKSTELLNEVLGITIIK
jgi:hypothetical protein